METLPVLFGLSGALAFLAIIWHLIRRIIGKADRTTICRKSFLISIVVFMVSVAGEESQVRFLVDSEIKEVELKRQAIFSELDGELEKAIYQELISKQAIQLVTGLKDDREKALAIASWIAANWRNASKNTVVHNSHKSKSMLAKFVNQTGACGTRIKIFVDMEKAVGLSAERYSIYNFGRVGGGHTAAQVFWDGKWHFFDVTYSGYCEKDRSILSLDEIVELDDEASIYLVPFDSFGDVYGRDKPPSKWVFVDNAERMTRIYKPENLRKSGSRGFTAQSTPVTLHFSMRPGEYLGSVNKSSRDVAEQGKEKNKSDKYPEWDGLGAKCPFFRKLLSKICSQVRFTDTKSSLPIPS